MSREFNVTGTCIPEMHYMVDISGKLDSMIKLIEKGSYFTINRPRQYGKTTTMFMLKKQSGWTRDISLFTTPANGIILSVDGR